MGHGGNRARRLLNQDEMQRGAPAPPESGARLRPLQAVVMLMGCSSAQLFQPVASVGNPCRPGGSFPAEFESFGMPISALIGGAPAMLGALWDVISGDLDVLTCALLRRWAGEVQTNGSAKDAAVRAASPDGILGALVSARKACTLPILTGASVVCYGIPV